VMVTLAPALSWQEPSVKDVTEPRPAAGRLRPSLSVPATAEDLQVSAAPVAVSVRCAGPVCVAVKLPPGATSHSVAVRLRDAAVQEVSPIPGVPWGNVNLRRCGRVDPWREPDSHRPSGGVGRRAQPDWLAMKFLYQW